MHEQSHNREPQSYNHQPDIDSADPQNPVNKLQDVLNDYNSTNRRSPNMLSNAYSYDNSLSVEKQSKSDSLFSDNDRLKNLSFVQNIKKINNKKNIYERNHMWLTLDFDEKQLFMIAMDNTVYQNNAYQKFLNYECSATDVIKVRDSLENFDNFVMVCCKGALINHSKSNEISLGSKLENQPNGEWISKPDNTTYNKLKKHKKFLMNDIERMEREILGDSFVDGQNTLEDITEEGVTHEETSEWKKGKADKPKLPGVKKPNTIVGGRFVGESLATKLKFGGEEDPLNIFKSIFVQK